jgi:aspartate racemase
VNSKPTISPKPSSSILGLVAGLGVGAGIFYYRSLVNAHLALSLTPRIVMVHADVEKVMRLANARESDQLADYLARFLGQLADAGAHVATIPAFSPQVCAQELEQRTPLPLIGLLDAITAEVSRRKLSRVAIFGAKVTIKTSLFGRLDKVAEVVPPQPRELEVITSIYGNIVKHESATAWEQDELRKLAHSLIEREGLDTIVLAGTDLSFVFTPENTDFPHLDGARSHVEAIMARLIS